MSYLLDPLMHMFLTDLPSHLLVWVWYLSCSQVLQHSTHWIHPNGPPHTAQTRSPSALKCCIPVFAGPPLNTSHNAPSAILKAKLLLSRKLEWE